MTDTEIISNLEKIQKELDLQIPVGDIDSTEAKMLNLSSMMGLSAECMKEAKNLLLVRQGFEIRVIRKQEPNINATTQKILLESALAKEITIYEYADRINSAITHCVDGLRTAISKYKSERELSAYVK